MTILIVLLVATAAGVFLGLRVGPLPRCEGYSSAAERYVSVLP